MCDGKPARPSSEEDFPADAPCEQETPCQGVCGGAVLQKPFVPSLDLAISTLVLLEQPEIQVVSRRFQRSFESDLLSGRQTRTLHMSFLC